jgi:hypothetical protein
VREAQVDKAVRRMLDLFRAGLFEIPMPMRGCHEADHQ